MKILTLLSIIYNDVSELSAKFDCYVDGDAIVFVCIDESAQEQIEEFIEWMNEDYATDYEVVFTREDEGAYYELSEIRCSAGVFPVKDMVASIAERKDFVNTYYELCEMCVRCGINP